MTKLLHYLKRYGQMVAGIGPLGGTVHFASAAMGRPGPRTVSLRGYPEDIHLRGGTSDTTVFNQIFLDEDYAVPSAVHESALSRYYFDCLRAKRTPLIIDCGANIGLASVWYAVRYPEARIYAVEPEPGNFEVLTRNARAYPGIVPVLAGIAGRSTRLALANVGGQSWGWQTVEDTAGAVDSITIQKILESMDSAVPFIVKVDIEGAEVDLFQGDVSWVQRTPLIVFESHDWLMPWRGLSHAVFSTLTTSGTFDYINKSENTFCFSHHLLGLAEQRPTPASLAR